ncbi:MAG: Hpt domain-containing protein [Treponema sp.]|nr:Hpt domain-containing protein [Treponema sp.]
MADDAVYVNCAEGIKRMMNNPKLYMRLLAKFKLDTKLDALEAAFGSGDVDKIHIEVHTLKGLAGNLSLQELSRQCIELEDEVKAGKQDQSRMDAVKAAFAATMREIDKVIAENG